MEEHVCDVRASGVNDAMGKMKKFCNYSATPSKS
jgi:hypothetical protein